jgi:phage portal protein BeeE
MGKITDYLRGRDLEVNGSESRTLDAGTVSEALLPVSKTALPAVNEMTALKIADVFSAVRCLADKLASLPVKAYRRVPQGRIPAGADARIARLLRAPSPGSTSADLIGQIVVDCCVYGSAFVAKYRADNEIVQLGTLPIR